MYGIAPLTSFQPINDFVDRDEVYILDAEESRPTDLADDIHYVSVDEVFEWMDTDGTRWQRSLYSMMGLENLSKSP